MAIRTEHVGPSRFYFDPEVRVTLPGVTSIISMAPKPWLAAWEARLAAERAVDNIDLVKAMAERTSRAAAVAFVKSAASEYNKSRRDLGSEVHDFFERIMRGEAVGKQRFDLEPYRVNFLEFLEVAQPEHVDAENIAWSDTYGYAGSFDESMILKISADETGKLFLDPAGGVPTLTLGDWKTGKKTYPEVALQLSAYEHADKVIRPDGTTYIIPVFGAAAVLHVTDTGWELKPVRTDQPVFDVFLALKTLFEWDRNLSKEVLGRPWASSEKGLITGTQRRGRNA